LKREDQKRRKEDRGREGWKRARRNQAYGKMFCYTKRVPGLTFFREVIQLFGKSREVEGERIGEGSG